MYHVLRARSSDRFECGKSGYQGFSWNFRGIFFHRGSLDLEISQARYAQPEFLNFNAWDGFRGSIFNLTYSRSRLLITLKAQLNENKCTAAPDTTPRGRKAAEEESSRKILRSNPLLKLNSSVRHGSIKILHPTSGHHPLSP